MADPRVQFQAGREHLLKVFSFVVKNITGTKYEKLNAGQIVADILKSNTGEFHTLMDTRGDVVGIISMRIYKDCKRMYISQITCTTKAAFAQFMKMKQELYPEYTIIAKRHGMSKTITPERMEAIYGRS
jgi:hypothetical protein